MTTPTSSLDLNRFLDDAHGLVTFVRGVCHRLNISIAFGDSVPTVSANVFSALDASGRDLSRLRSDQAAARDVRVRYEDFFQWLAEDFGIHLPRAAGEFDLSGFKDRVQAELRRRSERERELRSAIHDIASAAGVPPTAPSVDALKELVIASIEGVKARPPVRIGDPFLQTLARRLHVPCPEAGLIAEVEKGILAELDRWVAGDAERRKEFDDLRKGFAMYAGDASIVLGEVAKALGVTPDGQGSEFKDKLFAAIEDLKEGPWKFHGDLVVVSKTKFDSDAALLKKLQDSVHAVAQLGDELQDLASRVAGIKSRHASRSPDGE